MKFNLNNNITFKPTKKGIELIVDRHNNLMDGMPVTWWTTIERTLKRVNKNGEMTMQMHDFLDNFGCLGRDLPDYLSLNVTLQP